MNEITGLVMAGLAGLLLGMIFFGGLWWTVGRGVTSSRPAAWFLGSMVVRMTLVLGGFYFVANGQWQRMVLCLLGFALARLGVTRFSRIKEKQAGPSGTCTGGQP